MPIDALQVQLASAIQRFNAMQRRLPSGDTGNAMLGKVFHELESALEEVRVAQEQLLDHRRRMEELQVELSRQYQKYWELFDEMPDAYVVTKTDSTILEANKSAAELFNVSQRFLVGKTMSMYVNDDRLAWLAEVRRGVEGGERLEICFRLRPRERAAIAVRARVAVDNSTLRWVISPAEHVREV